MGHPVALDTNRWIAERGVLKRESGRIPAHRCGERRPGITWAVAPHGTEQPPINGIQFRDHSGMSFGRELDLQPKSI